MVSKERIILAPISNSGESQYIVLLNKFILLVLDKIKSYWECWLYENVLSDKINTCSSMKILFI